ncbi:MAG: hypothetical protein GY863_18340 [bacterium]|nr:hypothetical protein [bacterium]
MKRKEFLKKSLQAGLVTTGFVGMCGNHAFASGAGDDQEKSDEYQKFKEEWIKSFLKNLDEQFDEKTRINLLESCGRDCAKRGAIQLANSCKGDLKKFVDTLANSLGKENNYIDGDSVHLGYSKCLCHLVDKGPERLSDTWCNCSRGWVLEMFETVTGKKVKVELISSIKRGHDSCNFIINI